MSTCDLKIPRGKKSCFTQYQIPNDLSKQIKRGPDVVNPRIEVRDGVQIVTYNDQVPLIYKAWYQDLVLPLDCKTYLYPHQIWKNVL